MTTIKFKKLDERATIPSYAKPGDAGMDLRSIESYRIFPKNKALVQTGLALELPIGYEAQVRPRSGLALKHGLTVLNSPGTIDSGYRGEIGVIIINNGIFEFNIEEGDRIAQLVIARYAHPTIEEVVELSDSERGEHGFGSTGK